MINKQACQEGPQTGHVRFLKEKKVEKDFSLIYLLTNKHMFQPVKDEIHLSYNLCLKHAELNTSQLKFESRVVLNSIITIFKVLFAGRSQRLKR